MDVFFLILLNVVLPVFFLIAAGVLLHRKFKFDMKTLSKLNTYFLMPCVSFVNFMKIMSAEKHCYIFWNSWLYNVHP